jgi:hypothetical protein
MFRLSMLLGLAAEALAGVLLWLSVSLMYVNTSTVQRVLSEKSWRNRMNAVDLRALSPLIYSHVNPYGQFDLDMSKRLPIEADFALAA